MVNSQIHEYLFNNNLNENNGGPALIQKLACGAAAAVRRRCSPRTPRSAGRDAKRPRGGDGQGPEPRFVSEDPRGGARRDPPSHQIGQRSPPPRRGRQQPRLRFQPGLRPRTGRPADRGDVRRHRRGAVDRDDHPVQREGGCPGG